MSATVIRDTMVITSPETQPAAPLLIAQAEAELVTCECCELTEECTPEYIGTVRERYQGKWICGLCAEAVKDEIVRSQRLLSTEEAMVMHMNFCKKFSTSEPPPDPTVDLISAMKQILRRSLDSPRALRSTPTSPTKVIREIPSCSRLTRSESCFPTLSGVMVTCEYDDSAEGDNDNLHMDHES